MCDSQGQRQGTFSLWLKGSLPQLRHSGGHSGHSTKAGKCPFSWADSLSVRHFFCWEDRTKKAAESLSSYLGWPGALPGGLPCSPGFLVFVASPRGSLVQSHLQEPFPRLPFGLCRSAQLCSQPREAMMQSLCPHLRALSLEAGRGQLQRPVNGGSGT